jgi:uncharacterized protein YhbP (UPF0306 family)
METLAAINRWLAKQHVSPGVLCEGELWCANAFYTMTAKRRLLSPEKIKRVMRR